MTLPATTEGQHFRKTPLDCVNYSKELSKRMHILKESKFQPFHYWPCPPMQQGSHEAGVQSTLWVELRKGQTATLCAAISNSWVLHHHATLRPYNTQCLLWAWAAGSWAGRCHSLGQCHFLPYRPDTTVVQPAVHKCLPSTFLPFPQPNRRVFLFMAMEGIWPITLHQGQSPPGHGIGLWWQVWSLAKAGAGTPEGSTPVAWLGRMWHVM